MSRGRRRGFAMLMVVLLAGVIVLVSGVMLDRYATGRLSFERQLDAYRAHHAGRGLTEVIIAWLRMIPGSNPQIDQRVDDDGGLFDLVLDNGDVVAISMYDAQGAVMANPQALPKSNRDAGEGILRSLRSITGLPVPDAYVRGAGPVEISAQTAPEAVLKAVVLYATDGDGAPEFVREVLREREHDRIDHVFITQAAGRSGMSVDQTRILTKLLTDEPTLWRVRAEIRPRRSRTPTDAYEGLAIIEQSNEFRFTPWGPFISWQRVGVEPIP